MQRKSIRRTTQGRRILFTRHRRGVHNNATAAGRCQALAVATANRREARVERAKI